MATATESSRQPRLSDLGVDLLHLTKWQLTRTIAWPFVAFVAYWILAWSEHWILAVFSLIVLSFVTYGSTSHDLVHGNLGLNRWSNDLLLAVIELISIRSGHAYQAAHLNHHARFPHDDDIEAEAARMSLIRRCWKACLPVSDLRLGPAKPAWATELDYWGRNRRGCNRFGSDCSAALDDHPSCLRWVNDRRKLDDPAHHFVPAARHGRV